MTDTPPQDTAEPKPQADTVLWDFCINVGLRGAHDLRKVLGLDETNFRHIAAIAHAKPSRCYIYRVLDEVQKAAISIMQWKEYLSDGLDFGRGDSEEKRQFGRLAVESVIDDQQFRARKLSEVLVDSILFSTTNDEDHFRDYFSLYELNETARSQQDRQEFFGFQNRNAGWHAEWLLARIQELESGGLNPTTRWYLAEPCKAQKRWTTKGVPFSSFRQRYRQVVSVALPSELMILGKSYIHAYGMSKDVHFTPHDISSDFSVSDILMGTDKVALLILALVIRCQHLLDCVPEGVNRQYREMHDGNAYPTALVDGLKTRPADVGDIVWVQGDVAEVIDVTTSTYGYPAYHVKYLETPPITMREESLRRGNWRPGL